MIEKKIDKKLANRISYQIWYKGCLKGKFGRGSKSAKGGPYLLADLDGGVQIRCDTGLQSFFPAESGGINWLSRPKLNQPFRIDSDAALHMNLIRWIWFGSAEARRLNWALVVSGSHLSPTDATIFKNSNVLRNLGTKLPHLEESQ